MTSQDSKLKSWALFLANLRSWMQEKGYLEVSTPHLVPAGAFESSLDCLKVSWSKGEGQLHSSPEIEMKRLLAVSPTDIYQICHCFRDDPTETGVHSIEFTMLEFYKTETDYREILSQMKELIQALANEPVKFQERSFSGWLEKLTGVTWTESLDELKSQCREKNYQFSQDDGWEDLIFKLWVEQVETKFDPDTVSIVCDYPKEMSALSKTNGEIAERFEFYWRGMELCNGCTELTDRVELEKRFESENKKRVALGKDAHPLSKTLMNAVERLPDCAGVAVGLERLFAALQGKDSIQESFSLSSLPSFFGQSTSNFLQ